METTQGALFQLERWSEYWCLPLNPRKCEASFFSVDPNQSNLQPNLFLFGFRLRFNPTPIFLGVTFDRTLSFSKHVSSLKAKFFLCLKTLRCISASLWGPSKELLYFLHKAFLRPLFTYALPGWFLFLSVTNITKMERLHRVASGAITSCFSFPLIALLLSEVSLLPLRVTLTHFSLSSYEQALRLPTSFPISGLAGLEVKPRLHRSSWKAFASTHPLMLPSTSLREALLACPPLTPFFTVKSTLSFPCSCSDLISLAKVRFLPTLTLSPLMIWYFGLTALFLFLLAEPALTYLPTALSEALRPIFSFQQAQYVQVSLLKPAPFCMLFAGLGSTNKSPTSLLLRSDFCSVLITLPSPPSFLLPLSLANLA